MLWLVAWWLESRYITWFKLPITDVKQGIDLSRSWSWKSHCPLKVGMYKRIWHQRSWFMNIDLGVKLNRLDRTLLGDWTFVLLLHLKYDHNWAEYHTSWVPGFAANFKRQKRYWLEIRERKKSMTSPTKWEKSMKPVFVNWSVAGIRLHSSIAEQWNFLLELYEIYLTVSWSHISWVVVHKWMIVWH